VYSVNGRLLQLIRSAAAPVPLEETDIRAFGDSVLAATDSRHRPQMHRLFAELPPPPRAYPAYAPDLRVDGDLDLWVRQSSRTGEPGAKWRVFSATGILRGVVQLPRDGLLLDIGTDYLICLERDELDVEYVRKYRLRRGGVAAEGGSE